MPDFFTDIAPALPIVGGIINKISSDDRDAKNIAMQKEFAQHGVQWKADSARAAGLSPLVGVGANTTSFENVVGDAGELGRSLAETGQDISRSAYQGSGPTVREKIHQDKMNLLQEKKAEVEIQLLGSQIEKNRMVAPPVPDAFIKLKNADGSISYYPSKEAIGAGFFPGSRFLWEGSNKLLPSSEEAKGQIPSTFDQMFDPGAKKHPYKYGTLGLK